MAFAYDPLSPIHWVSAYQSPTSEQKVYVKSPSSLDYELEDVSEADAGRTEDAMMHKMRLGQVNKLILKWQNIPTSEAKDLMEMFDAEYFYVNFLDPRKGVYHTERMYRGNISASMYSNWNGGSGGASGGIWTLGFSIIRAAGGTLI